MRCWKIGEIKFSFKEVHSTFWYSFCWVLCNHVQCSYSTNHEACFPCRKEHEHELNSKRNWQKEVQHGDMWRRYKVAVFAPWCNLLIGFSVLERTLRSTVHWQNFKGTLRFPSQPIFQQQINFDPSPRWVSLQVYDAQSNRGRGYHQHHAKIDNV